jgi:hypothetical protein
MVMNVMRIRTAFILAAALAAPAAAYSVMAEVPKESPRLSNCFASGASTFQIVAKAAAPDYRIRIDSAAAHPDLRMQLVDRPEHADFVLVDDADGEPGNCRSARTVTHDGAAGKPDVTVHLSTDAKNVDYRLYVRSARFSQKDAAALLAAMWKADRSRKVAALAPR